MMAAPRWVWEDSLISESKGQSKICAQHRVTRKFRTEEENKEACYQKEEMFLAKVGRRKEGSVEGPIICHTLA